MEPSLKEISHILKDTHIEKDLEIGTVLGAADIKIYA